MQNLLFSLLFCIVFLSCKGPGKSLPQPLEFIDTTKPFKREITGYGDRPSIFYTLAKAKQNQMGLDSIENGFDNLQIRIWYDFGLVDEKKLVVITNMKTNWAATVYDMEVHWDGYTETLLSKHVRHAIPKSGWADFVKKLLDLQIVYLPDSDNLPGYGDGMDGNSYNVEIATKNQYRFYGYAEPKTQNPKIWQAKNMADILDLIEEELGVEQEAKWFREKRDHGFNGKDHSYHNQS